MNTVQKSLFVGALLGTGLCSSAIAGEFSWSGSSSSITGPAFLLVSGNDGTFDLASGSFSQPTFDISANATGASATAAVTEFGMSMSASLGQGGQQAKSDFEAIFTVGSTIEGLFEWDFTGSLGGDPLGTVVKIRDLTTGVFIVDLNLNSNTIGSLVLDLVANREYSFKSNLRQMDGLSTMSLGENTITVVPLPPAGIAGLGLLGGMAVKRRLRK